MPAFTTVSGCKVRAFVPLVLDKQDGSRIAYLTAPTRRGRDRRWTVRKARQWAKDQRLTSAFIDTRRRDGTTYWKEIRL